MFLHSQIAIHFTIIKIENISLIPKLLTFIYRWTFTFTIKASHACYKTRIRSGNSASTTGHGWPTSRTKYLCRMWEIDCVSEILIKHVWLWMMWMIENLDCSFPINRLDAQQNVNNFRRKFSFDYLQSSNPCELKHSRNKFLLDSEPCRWRSCICIIAFTYA